MSVTMVRRVLLAVFCVAFAGAPSASASSRHDRTEASIIRAMNQARASHGLPKLRTNRGLARAADAHSKVMRRTKTVRHGDYTKRVRRYVHTRRVGENIAWRRGCDPRAIVDMWLRSAPHRAVVLSRSFRRIGVARRGKSLCFVTADFASAH